MMRKILLGALMLFTFCGAFAQSRKGTMVLQGQECEFDSLISRKIGPGAKYTQYQFNSIKEGKFTYKMRAHVIEVDMTNPYNSFKPYLTYDSYFTVKNQVQQVKWEKDQGRKPVASMAGLGWFQSNYSGTDYQPYENRRSIVRDKEIRYEEDGKVMNLYYGADRIAHWGYTQFTGEAKNNSVTIPIGQVNHYRDRVDAVGKATLFCNGITKSASYKNADKGIDIRIKKKDGTRFKIGQNECEVLEVLTACSHDIGAGEAIIACGETLAASLTAPQAGDNLMIDLSYTDGNGAAVDIEQMFSAEYGYSVKNGEPVGMGGSRTAFPTYGISKDGKTLYLADLENSEYSNCSTIYLAELLSKIGVWTAYWGDGGPSAEMTVGGQWATTSSVGSGFNGRVIPAASIVYSTAPDDKTVTTIDVLDPRPKDVIMGGTFDIYVYGYNQYDEIVSEGTGMGRSVTITSDLGTVNKTTFTATEYGTGYVEVKLNGVANPSVKDGTLVRIPITVKDDAVLTVVPQSLFTGENRTVQAKLKYEDKDGVRELDPTLATWTTDNTNVVSSCTGGLITPYMDGYATVTAEYNGLKASTSVTVENLETEGVTSVQLKDEITNDTVYNIHLPSVPHSFTAVFSNNSTVDLNIKLFYMTGETIREKLITVAKDGRADRQGVTVDLDYDDVATYPAGVLYACLAEDDENNPDYVPGAVTLSNLNAIKDMLMGKITVDTKADQNGDGKVTIVDLTLMIEKLKNDGVSNTFKLVELKANYTSSTSSNPTTPPTPPKPNKVKAYYNLSGQPVSEDAAKEAKLVKGSVVIK